VTRRPTDHYETCIGLQAFSSSAIFYASQKKIKMTN